MNTLLARTVVFAAAVTALTRPVAAQDEVRKLFESGKYQEVVERTSGESAPEARYLKALAHRKLNQNDQAKEAFRQLAEAGDAWKAVGESGVALVDGNVDDAVNAARTAVERNAEQAEAQFQLGQRSMRRVRMLRPRKRSPRRRNARHNWRTRTITPA